jgi:hypothetical protein
MRGSKPMRIIFKMCASIGRESKREYLTVGKHTRPRQRSRMRSIIHGIRDKFGSDSQRRCGTIGTRDEARKDREARSINVRK